MCIYWNTTKGTLRYVNLQLLVWTCKWGREGEREGGGGKKDLVNELHTHWDGEGQLLPLSMEFSRRAEFSPCTFSLNNKEIIEEYGLITHRKQLCCAPAHTFRVCSGTEWYFAEMGSETTDGWWLRRVGWARMLHLMFLSHFSSRLGRVNKLVESLAWYLCRKIFSRFLLSV